MTLRAHRLLWSLVALILVGLATLSSVGNSLTSRQITSRQLPSNIQTLTIDNDRGTVRVERVSAGSIPSVSSTSEWQFADPEARVEVSGSTVALIGRCPAMVVGSCHIDWVVRVPAGVDLTAATDVGAIKVAALTGEVDLTVDVGSVTVTDAGGGSVRARSSVGEVTVSTLRPDCRVEAEAGTGSVLVWLPDGASYDVSVATEVGSETVAVDTSGTGTWVSARTSVGDVSVRYR